ncbi:hypothetical protein BS47DRAFT_845666 [Hydnum rufescens UP504]|uniref:Uncharacterized protein n=1 Tax=Hydnum rufescens UP504 TaxID=1448309 RepID=A0A9P6B9Q8_9AGAM|nr:hypothetical protein BS47DRAFT_845666 [Hydnum rufescens UP504]
MVFKLSATLTGNTQDVRAVASPSPSLVLSASQDTKAIAWTRPDTGSSFIPSKPFDAGTGFVKVVHPRQKFHKAILSPVDRIL